MALDGDDLAVAACAADHLTVEAGELISCRIMNANTPSIRDECSAARKGPLILLLRSPATALSCARHAIVQRSHMLLLPPCRCSG